MAPLTAAEAVLRNHSTQLEQAQQIAHIGHFEHDLDTGIITMSDENYRILGLEKAPCITHEQGQRFLHPDDFDGIMQHWTEAMVTGTFSHDYRIVRTDGTTRYVHGEGRVLFDESGRPRRVFGTIQDVTERRLIENRLHAREQELRAIVENTPDLIARCDTEGRFLFVNGTVERTLGITAAAMLGRRLSNPTGMLDGDLQKRAVALRDMVREAARSAQTIEREFHVVLDGTAYVFNTRAVPERTADGVIESVLLIGRDVSDRVRADEARRQADEARRQLLGEVMRARESERAELARQLHDEVGQQVSALLFGLELLVRAKSAGEARERSMRLRDVAVDTLASLRRMAHGLHPLALDALGLASAVKQSATEYAETFGIPLELDVRAPEGVRLPKEVELALYRMYLEALTNVARHSGAARAAIALHISGDGVLLKVRDNGCGFDLPEIMNAADPSRAFGLRGIIENAAVLGGAAQIATAAGAGTTLSITVPLPKQH